MWVDRGSWWSCGAALGCVAMAMAMAACSGTSESEVTAGDSGVPDGGTDAPAAEAPYTLDDVCERLAPTLCKARQKCCASIDKYDEAGCIAHAKADCGKDVAEARAGREDFHADRIAACIPKFEAILGGSCTLTLPRTIEIAGDLKSCQIFTGHLAEGAKCERDSQCETSIGTPDAKEVTRITSCDNDKNVCKTTRIMGEGGACSFADPPALCNDGLACSTLSGSGTCAKSKGVDETCATSLECGLGYMCTGDKVCAAAKTDGTCKDPFECASLKCASAGAGAAKTCTPLPPLVKHAECVGP